MVNTPLEPHMWIYNFKMSNQDESYGHEGKFLVHFKIVVGDKIIEQISNFLYFGCDVNYEHGNNKNKKLYINMRLYMVQ